MLGYVIPPRKRLAPNEEEFVVPADLRRRLGAWIDVDEVGPDGFWLWFRAVLPLLPAPGEATSSGFRETDRREEHRRLVEYARDRARLSVICEQYARENQILARRIRALEGALRTIELAGHPVAVPDDGEAEEMVERYQSPAHPRHRRGASIEIASDRGSTERDRPRRRDGPR